MRMVEPGDTVVRKLLCLPCAFVAKLKLSEYCSDSVSVEWYSKVAPRAMPMGGPSGPKLKRPGRWLCEGGGATGGVHGGTTSVGSCWEPGEAPGCCVEVGLSDDWGASPGDEPDSLWAHARECPRGVRPAGANPRKTANSSAGRSSRPSPHLTSIRLEEPLRHKDNVCGFETHVRVLIRISQDLTNVHADSFLF